jgi:orotate phosphoribosyltransferase
MDESEVLTLLRRTGAFQTGHFLLSSGMHSPQYVQCALLLQHPQHAAAVGAAVADRFRSERVQVVLGPAYGGMTIAHEVARSLGARSLFAERVEGRFELRRSFQIDAGERTLVVEDVVTTGAATREVKRLVERLGGVVVGVGAIVDRTAAPLEFDCRFEALATIDAPAYLPSMCELCQQGVPLVKPGSRPLPAAAR